VCLELLAEAGAGWDAFNVRRQCIPGAERLYARLCHAFF